MHTGGVAAMKNKKQSKAKVDVSKPKGRDFKMRYAVFAVVGLVLALLVLDLVLYYIGLTASTLGLIRTNSPLAQMDSREVFMLLIAISSMSVAAIALIMSIKSSKEAGERHEVLINQMIAAQKAADVRHEALITQMIDERKATDERFERMIAGPERTIAALDTNLGNDAK